MVAIEDAATEAADVSAGAGFDIEGPERFINRELSWLSFNTRVLEECANASHPLLERLRFLSISASNLDEFYMVRVAGLKGQVAAGFSAPSQDGLTPSQQLETVSQQAGELMRQQHLFWNDLVQELREAGIAVLAPDEIDIGRGDDADRGAGQDRAFVGRCLQRSAVLGERAPRPCMNFSKRPT